MNSDPVIFGIRVSPVPILNARMEFGRYFSILCSGEFREQVLRWKFGTPLNAGHIIWGGLPSGLLTWFLQRAIISVEAYIPSAAFMAAIHYGRLTDQVRKSASDPFSLECHSTANTFYNCVPALVEPDFRMIRAKGSLWKEVRRFYDEVRNPIFHGSGLGTDGHKHGETLDSVIRAFELFVQIYNWVDWWFPPGGVAVSEPPRLPMP
jgi:hypothetical protein